MLGLLIVTVVQGSRELLALMTFRVVDGSYPSCYTQTLKPHCSIRREKTEDNYVRS